MYIKKATAEIILNGKTIATLPKEYPFLILEKKENVLGKSIKVYLKTGASFYLKVTSGGNDWISGYDEESNDIHVLLNDIDFIVMDGAKL